MKREYYESLKNLHDNEVRFKLSVAVYDKKNKLRDTHSDFNDNYFDSIGIAYVLLLAQTKSGINPETLETFLSTAELSEDMNEIVRRYTANYWDIVNQFYNVFTKEQLQAFILFQNTDANLRYTPVFPTPESITELACKILEIKNDDTVLDLCSGVGTFLIDAYWTNPKAEYTGVELYYAASDVAKIRSHVMGAAFTLQLSDALEYRAPKKVDKIFSNYPWRLKNKGDDTHRERIQQYFNMDASVIQRASSEWLFNAVIIQQLRLQGKAVVIMPSGCIDSGKDKAMRQYFVENGYVEAVIMLPDKLFAPYSAISTCLLVLSHNNTSVQLIDARKYYKTDNKSNYISNIDMTIIIGLLSEDGDKAVSKTIAELKENDYILSAPRYLETLPDLDNAIPFKEVCRSISRGTQIASKEINQIKTDEPTPYRYLSLANINNGIISYEDKAIYLKELPDKMKKYCIKNNSVVISKVSAAGGDYKSAVVKVDDGETILADGNIIVIEVDETKADPYYIQAFLASETGTAVMQRLYTGNTILTISISNLENTLIPLPSLAEQREIGNNYAARMDEVILLKRKLERAMDKMKHTYDEEEYYC